MSRKNIARILDGIDPAFVEECAAYRGGGPSERNAMEKHHKPTRRLAVALLAACLVVALAVTGYATGAVQSLIAKYWSGFHYATPDDQLREDNPDYAAWLDQELETQSMMVSIGEKALQVDELYQIPGLRGAGVRLLETYYDGEKIALACQFRAPEQTVDFTFDAQDPAYANLPYQTVKADGYPSYSSMVKDPADLQAIAAALEKDGQTSFLAFNAWISDHIYANGEDLGPCHSDPDENGIFIIDPVVMGIGDVVLSESSRNLPEITVSLTYTVATYAYKLEGDTVQYADVGRAQFPVSFTVTNLNPESIPAPWSLNGESLNAGEPIAITQTIRGTTVSLRGTVPQVNQEDFRQFTMETDTALWESFGREQALERFPQIEADLEAGETKISISDEETGNLLLSLQCPVEGIPGYMDFLDVRRDLNGSLLDDGWPYAAPNYITGLIPDGMDLTAQEAGEQAAELLERYSCFRFTPWNVLAEYNSREQKGCYRITLQASYQGLPVYGFWATSRAFYSNDGLDICNGLMMLKQTGQTELASPLPVEEAIELFVNNVHRVALGDAVKCEKLTLGYLAVAQGEQVVLSPAWVFECSQEISGMSGDDYFAFYVLAEDGSMCHNALLAGTVAWLDPA